MPRTAKTTVVYWWLLVLLQGTSTIGRVIEDTSVAGNPLCAFGTNSLVHLRLTQKLLNDGGDFGQTVEAISAYRHAAAKTLAALYELGSVRKLNPFWMLTLYTDLVRFYHCHDGNGNAQEVTVTEDEQRLITADLLEVHEFVASELAALTENECRLSTVSDSPKEYNMSSSLTGKEYSQAMSAAIGENVARALTALERDHRNLQAIATSSLYLSDFGSRADVVRDVTKGYDVDVQWNDVPQKLLAAWKSSHNPAEWPVSGFQNLKEYYQRTTDLVKTVMWRLTLKHLLHVKKRFAAEEFRTAAIANNPDSEDNANVLRWFAVLTDFVDLFDLGGDPDCRYLIDSYSDPIHIYADRDCKNIITAIYAHLSLLSISQGCDAGGPLRLNDMPPVLQLNTVQDLTSIVPPLDPQGQPIQNNSIRIGVAFVNHMKQMFVDVDFKVIRLFLRNADDINKFKVPQQ